MNYKRGIITLLEFFISLNKGVKWLIEMSVKTYAIIVMTFCIFLMVFVLLLVVFKRYTISSFEFVCLILIIPQFFDFFYFKGFYSWIYNKFFKPLSDQSLIINLAFNQLNNFFNGEIYNFGLVVGSFVLVFALYTNLIVNPDWDQLDGYMGAILYLISIAIYFGDYAKWYDSKKFKGKQSFLTELLNLKKHFTLRMPDVYDAKDIIFPLNIVIIFSICIIYFSLVALKLGISGSTLAGIFTGLIIIFILFVMYKLNPLTHNTRKIIDVVRNMDGKITNFGFILLRLILIDLLFITTTAMFIQIKENGHILILDLFSILAIALPLYLTYNHNMTKDQITLGLTIVYLYPLFALIIVSFTSIISLTILQESYEPSQIFMCIIGFIIWLEEMLRLQPRFDRKFLELKNKYLKRY